MHKFLPYLTLTLFLSCKKPTEEKFEVLLLQPSLRFMNRLDSSGIEIQYMTSVLMVKNYLFDTAKNNSILIKYIERYLTETNIYSNNHSISVILPNSSIENQVYRSGSYSLGIGNSLSNFCQVLEYQRYYFNQNFKDSYEFYTCEIKE